MPFLWNNHAKSQLNDIFIPAPKKGIYPNQDKSPSI